MSEQRMGHRSRGGGDDLFGEGEGGGAALVGPRMAPLA